MLRPAEAWQRIAADLVPLDTEVAPRREATGRVLAESLAATVDVPADDVSAMDGFAVAGEVAPAANLPIQGTVAAGDLPGASLAPGAALRIMTGAPVPDRADRVVPVEQTEPSGQAEIRVLSGVEQGAHIRCRGEVLRRGMGLLPPGSLLTPAAVSLLATHGFADVTVYRKPRVAVLATGDEVVPPETEPRPGQLRDSHTDFLLAAGRGLDLEFTSLGIAPDRPAVIRDKIRQGLEADVFLITGGVSMGEYDFVETVLAELNCRVLFDAVAIQPGKPLVAARQGERLVFGLPGNPASVMVAFWLFVRPVLRLLQGLPDGFWSGALEATLATPLPGAKGRDRFLSAEVQFESGRLSVTPRMSKGSHDLAAFGQGTALVRVPAHADPAAPGDLCEILPIAGWPHYRSSTS